MAAMLALSAVPCAGAEPSTPDSSAAYRGVIVLREGGVLEGEIVCDGDRYLVSSGSRTINVDAANIEMVCGSLEEAYDKQRGAIERPTAETHLTLAEWCLRHGLLSQAAHELAEARALDARHPELQLLERRFAVAREQRREATTPQGPIVEHAPDDRAEAPKSPSSEQRDLRAIASELPEGAIHGFTRRIQPLLVNSCATAGCHQTGGPHEFQLDRSLLHGMGNRRSTTHNLQATLALVNRERPEESPLLTIPRRPHGDMEQAVFGAHDAELVQALVDWVALVTYDEQKAQQEASEANVSGNSHAAVKNNLSADRIEAGVAPDDVMHAHYLAPAIDRGHLLAPPRKPQNRPLPEAEQALQPASSEELATLRPAPRVRYGAQLRRKEPRDEFDPELFNQQFGNRPSSDP